MKSKKNNKFKKLDYKLKCPKCYEYTMDVEYKEEARDRWSILTQININCSNEEPYFFVSPCGSFTSHSDWVRKDNNNYEENLKNTINFVYNNHCNKYTPIIVDGRMLGKFKIK